MANKRKDRKRSSSQRIDYTQGGRVSKQIGGVPQIEELERLRREQDRQNTRDTLIDRPDVNGGGMKPTAPVFPVTGGPVGNVPPLQTKPATEPTPAPTPAPTPSPEEIKKEQLRQSIDDAAAGKVPTQAVVPDAIPVPDTAPQQVTTMDAPTTVQTRTAPGVAPEQVTTVDQTAQAQTPEQIQAAQMAATTVDTDAQVEAATGDVSDDAIAQAAGVERVPTIEAADVEIPEGALTERVVGALSPEAQSTAVMNVGSSLARVTRAKKQLANAGLSDADITELGNDPEALEDRLADFSEAERGIIAGLPEEALVSNQIDTLLKGIEEGEIPTWARPAVSAVESVLAQRGMSASTVGRDALLNAIIQSAMPIAQSNAQAIQASVGQQRTIEAQEAEANAARGQQTALTNASNVFQLNMAQFSADQQTALSNSKFLQTVGLTNASMEQQGIMQDAVMMSQANLAEANFNQQAQIQNAQSFLQMDLTNLSNEQQSNILRSQQTQQRLLSNQASQNAAAQFNATSENQTNQYMASLNAQINQFNAAQQNATEQFNVTQSNAAAARDAQRQADLNKFNTQLATQVEQFNANQDFARNQWNAQNVAAVEASNVQWRRQTNVANTAAQNAVNMQNAQNAFALTQTAQSFLWQELRDQADYDFRISENERNRIAQLVNTALASDPSKYNSSLGNLNNLIGLIAGDVTGI
tara:strand:- start:803 stop:2899 length:2097 start_codon:yes stop_codon:yes gene_type:complete